MLERAEARAPRRAPRRPTGGPAGRCRPARRPSAPTASAVVNSPNEAAPVWNTVLASAARVSWKLNTEHADARASARSAAAGRAAPHVAQAVDDPAESRRRRRAARPGTARRRASGAAPTSGATRATRADQEDRADVEQRRSPGRRAAGPMIRAVLKVAAESDERVGQQRRADQLGDERLPHRGLDRVGHAEQARRRRRRARARPRR